MARPRQVIDMQYMIGDWTLLHEVENRLPGEKRAIVCKCKCGKIRSVLEQNLLSKKSLSCGCRQRQIASEYKKTYWRDRGSKQRSTDKTE